MKKNKTEMLKNEILKYSKQNIENIVTLAPRMGDNRDDSDDFFCKYGYSWDYVFVLPVPGTVKKESNLLTGKTNIETISLYNIDEIDKDKEKVKVKNIEIYRDRRDYDGEKEKEGEKSEMIHDISPMKNIEIHLSKDRNGLFLFENPMKGHLSGQRDGFGVIDVSARTVLYCTVLYCTVLYCTVLYCTVLYCTVLYCIMTRFLITSRLCVVSRTS